jgi:hypothetical protein
MFNVYHACDKLYGVSKLTMKAINAIKNMDSFTIYLEILKCCMTVFPMGLKSTQLHWLLVMAFFKYFRCGTESLFSWTETILHNNYHQHCHKKKLKILCILCLLCHEENRQ